jgi:hypothetical protein
MPYGWTGDLDWFPAGGYRDSESLLVLVGSKSIDSVWWVSFLINRPSGPLGRSFLPCLPGIEGLAIEGGISEG